MLDPKITKILARFEETSGPGGDVTEKDHETVIEYVTEKLIAEGVTPEEAHDLTRFMHWGSWASGWNKGYTSGKLMHPRFSLNNN